MNEYYDIYLAVTEPGLITTTIQFGPCLEIDDERFKEGGEFYAHITDMGDPWCPLEGNVHYNGLMGTNLFVTPNTDYTEEENWANYENSYIFFSFATDSFDAGKFLDGDIDYPFTPTYDDFIRDLQLYQDDDTSADFKNNF
jgi:hypothetical protein